MAITDDPKKKVIKGKQTIGAVNPFGKTNMLPEVKVTADPNSVDVGYNGDGDFEKRTLNDIKDTVKKNNLTSVDTTSSEGASRSLYGREKLSFLKNQEAIAKNKK